MEDPKITWYAKLNKESQYEETNDYYAGSYTPGHPIDVDIQIWNNRFGLEDVANLADFYIVISFEHVEDSALFDYCTIVLDDANIIPLKKSGKKAILELPDTVVLSGTKNDGTLDNNKDHYINIEFQFDAEGSKLKENDLKDMYFQIIQK